jgi:cbb3-type cytochrome oxidase subunit 3
MTMDDNTAELLSMLVICGFFLVIAWIAYRSGSED